MDVAQVSRVQDSRNVVSVSQRENIGPASNKVFGVKGLVFGLGMALVIPC